MKPIRFLKFYNLYFSLLFILIIWLVTVLDHIYSLDLYEFGILPRNFEGLRGILLAPIIHEDWKHAAANSMALIVVMPIVFYSYRKVATSIFFWIYIMCGIWTWSFARSSYHIGASGLSIGLTSFIFFSGIIRQNMQLMAWSCLMLFLYGSVVWQLFPSVILPQNISWESHLSGFIAGIILAIIYRKIGPQCTVYQWEQEDNDDENEPTDQPPYWQITEENETTSNQNPIK